ncbi:hypothetical protein [Vibrio metschnikovii]|uniref:hypothetical protein n=1 Tax=Vibrio metschnikovii TaxID=28172 RepID=UPI001C30619C|nr:hypothetical protein [Vibrio metschnikovii]
MKIEHALITLIWILSVVSAIGVGYALGGANEQEAANNINAIIALASSLSAIAAASTLFFAFKIRSDWLKPKKHDSSVDLMVMLNEWSQNVRILNMYLWRFRSSDELDLRTLKNKVDYVAEVEEQAWCELQKIRRKHEIVCGYNKELYSNFQKIRDLRMRVVINVKPFKEHLCKVETLEQVEQHTELCLSKNIEIQVKAILSELKKVN